MGTTWIVHKFGGTSVADAERYRSVGRILLASRRAGARSAVVVSAMSGVTDALLEAVGLAARQDESYLTKLHALRERHLETVGGLGLEESRRQALAEVITTDFKDLGEVLRGVWIARLDSERIREFVSGYGELWSAQMLHAHLASSGADSDWRDALAASEVESDLERFVEHVHAAHLPHAVVIDATASDELPLRYESWLARGLHVITPNKKANSGPAARYRSLREAARRHGRYFLYETNVGAGLPIIHTLRELIETGDEIRRVEGVFSGTLSFIFNSLDGTRPFSEIVRDAHARGFTEPDPRDDLSGTDVARKLIILARELGHAAELEDVTVESLVPAELRAASAEEFLSGLSRHDGAMAETLRGARERGQVLRYVGTIDEEGRASAGLRPFPAEHPFAGLQGSDNVVSFRTARYDAQPMIVRGPGAGPEVTAAGVFADVLRLATFLGAPQ